MNQEVISKMGLKKLLLIFIIIYTIAINCSGKEGDLEVRVTDSIRYPAVAGAFYPADKDKLTSMITEFLTKAQVPELKGRVVAVIAPHAGYIYSGQVAAYSFKALEGQDIDTVILMGGAHRVGFRGAALDIRDYETPLGIVKTDKELVKELDKLSDDIFINPKPHNPEHSLEVELPFLQMVVKKDFKIVPILFGYIPGSAPDIIANKLPDLLKDKKYVIVASTDLSHYPPYKDAMKVDKETLDLVCKMEIEKLAQRVNTIESGSTSIVNLRTPMCGSRAVITTLKLLKKLGINRGILLKYANSGDTAYGDKGRVVGYGSVVFLLNKEKKEKNKEVSEEMSSKDDKLTLEEQNFLLKIARQTLEKLEPIEVDESKLTPRLKELRGVFVTLTKYGNLRGCIGYIKPIKPLYQAVIDNTLNAALHDPRFNPVTKSEVKDIEIEISVLTPLREISGPEEFIVGKHGIQIQYGYHSAVFLPQVAPEQGWDRATTLNFLCRKAGLPPDTWRKAKDMKFYVFEAQVFHEKR